jgi:hypothetical protein
MVKSKNQHNQKEGVKQGGKEGGSKARKIKASTHHGYVDEHLNPYGGLLPLVKLWDGLKFDGLFSTYYCEPTAFVAFRGIVHKSLSPERFQPAIDFLLLLADLHFFGFLCSSLRHRSNPL